MIRVFSVAIMGLALFIAFGLSPAPTKRILFIGNSFTYGGDIPAQVGNIAATGRPSVRYHVEMVVRGGTTLDQHLAETDALERLRRTQWDVVILQDASEMSFRPEWVMRMATAASVFSRVAQEQGADILYFAHWAPESRSDDRPDAIRTIEETYEWLARETGGRVARAGRLWQLADEAGMDGLYSEDAHHASLKGAYAAALAIAVALGDVDVTRSSWAPEAVSPADQDWLRHAAQSLSNEDGTRATDSAF
ncbi:hypothetical protein R3X27_12480 [Tropicimonas sp. TH_r6]|uniref:DUF4886 domain-containing protein n=1 Tax=Tropicimonas sp. TH_r6 TaxID=3082085 RepID=UPI0029542751|nr:DUF4886 domain-containing protein [Tropicimonas sp. TH_r6]MDV7143497.1 hypothetical protein [Tropicimonas sp. TH_r6]